MRMLPPFCKYLDEAIRLQRMLQVGLRPNAAARNPALQLDRHIV
jgi:hypothetical protein